MCNPPSTMPATAPAADVTAAKGMKLYELYCNAPSTMPSEVPAAEATSFELYDRYCNMPSTAPSDVTAVAKEGLEQYNLYCNTPATMPSEITNDVSTDVIYEDCGISNDVAMDPGQRLIVRLNADEDGGTWTVQSTPGCLTYVDSGFKANSAGPSGGLYEFAFLANHPGQDTLTLQFARPDPNGCALDPPQVLRTLDLNVTVSGSLYDCCMP